MAGFDRPPQKRTLRRRRRRQELAAAVLPLLLGVPAQGQVAPGGLGTRVNGQALGACQAGSCLVEGGSRGGANLFHRFQQFDTRNGVSQVVFDNRGAAAVIVGVTHPSGSFINRPVALLEKANLFWLSPGGIWLGSGASFSPLRSLVLSTATTLPLAGNQRFDAVTSTAQEAASLTGAADPLNQRLEVNLASLRALGLAATGPLVLAGGQLAVDESLLVQAAEGRLQALAGAGSRLQVGQEPPAGVTPANPAERPLAVRLSGRELSLATLSINAGRPGERGNVLLETVASPSSGAGALLLEGSQLEGQQLELRAPQVRVRDSRLEAPKGMIRLDTAEAAAGGDLEVISSQLDVGVRRLEDLQTPASITVYQSGGAKVVAPEPTPLIHLRSAGAVSVSQGSQLQASQDLTPLRRERTAAGQGALTPAQIQLTDVSGNVVVDAAGRITIADSRISADASDNLAGTILLASTAAERSAEGIQASQPGVRLTGATLSASGGAGGGDIWLQSASGIALQNSILRAESPHGPSLDGSSLDWQLAPFSGGEITLRNSASAWPVWVEGSRLAAPTHVGGGGLKAGFEDPDTGALTPFNDKSDIRDNPSSDLTEHPSGAYGRFPQGRIRILSEGGLTIQGGSQLDASSPAPDPATGWHSLAGEIVLFQQGNGPGNPGLTLNSASLLAIGDPSTAPGFSLPDLPDLPLVVGGPGAIALWSRNDIRLEGSRIDSGEGGSIQVLAAGALDDASSTLTSGSDPLSSERILRGRGPDVETLLSDPEQLPAQQATLHQQEIGALLTSSRQWRQPSSAVILETGKDPQIVAVDPAGRVSRTLRPSRDTLISLLGADLTARLGLNEDPLPPPPPQARQALRLSDPFNEPATAGSPSRSAGNVPASTGDWSVRELERSQGEQQFAQAEQQASQETRQGLGLGVAALGQPMSSEWLQQQLQTIGAQITATAGFSYRPAIVRLNLGPATAGRVSLDLLYLPPQGAMQGWRVEVSEEELRRLISTVQRQYSRFEPVDPEAQGGAPQQLADLLLRPLLPGLRRDGVTALLLSVDRGLQAVPYAALPIGKGELLGTSYALTLTPSLGLTALAEPPRRERGRMLLGGSSRFANGLASLPLVRSELQTLAAEHPAELLLDQEFTNERLLQTAARSPFGTVHLATHADFRPGQPLVARLYTGSGDLDLTDLGRSLRRTPGGRMPDLLSLSACRTALGNEQSELGLVGLALRTGSRSALGTLWFVDDAASAAFFVEFYRQLGQGLPKDEALRRTRLAFSSGTVRALEASLVGSNNRTLVAGLSSSDRQRFTEGMRHPYFWASMVLSGSPW